jgi:DNA-3-methyladenine glycosylase II
VANGPKVERSRFRLKPSPPFKLDLTAWALRRRPRNLIDVWDGQCYSRIVVLDRSRIFLVVTQTAPSERPELQCEYTCIAGPPKDERLVIGAVQRLLGIYVCIRAFEQVAARDFRLAALVKRFAGFRPPRFPIERAQEVN